MRQIANPLVGLATGLTVVGHHPSAEITWAVALCIVSTLAYVSFFSVGLGPLTSVYTTEVFPLRVRALGFGVGVTCNRVTSGVISMSFLSLSRAVTIGGSFFLYAGMAALACLFFFVFLPETRGLTLEETAKLFGVAADDTGMEAEGPAGKDKAVEIEMPTN